MQQLSSSTHKMCSSVTKAVRPSCVAAATHLRRPCRKPSSTLVVRATANVDEESHVVKKARVVEVFAGRAACVGLVVGDVVTIFGRTSYGNQLVLFGPMVGLVCLFLFAFLGVPIIASGGLDADAKTKSELGSSRIAMIVMTILFAMEGVWDNTPFG
jgi:hypothetical protein